MAYPTVEQIDKMARMNEDLAREGLPLPATMQIEETDAPYGIILLQWQATLGPDRVAIIRPDGTSARFTALR